MALFSNTKMKGSLYFLFFLLGLILCGYLYYFLFYIPAREARLNDEAISTIRNIREGIVAKEKHYRQLLQTSHDLDLILFKKNEASESELVEAVAPIYIELAPHSLRENIILKSDLNERIEELKDYRELLEYAELKNQIDEYDLGSLKRLELQYKKLRWETEVCLIQADSGKYEKKRLSFIEIGQYSEYADLKSAKKVFVIEDSSWKEAKILAEDKIKANSDEKDSDKIIAKNYRDFSMKILKSSSDFNGLLNKKIQLIQDDEIDKKTNPSHVVTIKEGLERKIIVAKKNNDAPKEAVSASDSLFGMISMADFMTGVADSKLFDCVILFDKHNIFYTNNPRILSKQSTDSLQYYVDENIGIDIREHYFNGKPYMQFTAPISIGNEAFHITGLIDSQDYTAYTKGVPFFFLLIILLLAMFIVSIVPSIKIFVITQWERLKMTDITFAGIGVLLGTFVLCLLLFTSSYYFHLKRTSKDSLIAWNDSISKSFKHEVLKTVHELEAQPLTPIKSNKQIFHEIATLEKSGNVTEIHLPYYKDTKVNKEGVYFKKVGIHTNLSKRAYFYSYAMESNYRLHANQDSLTRDIPFYIQSVFSLKRGKKEAVVSILSDKSNADYVRIKSTDLNSVMLRSTPIGYQYAILNRSGEILFSSDKEKNGLKNILAQSDDCSFIRQAIHNDIPDQGEFGYGKNSFQAAITPIKYITSLHGGKESNYPLFILTYADKSISTWKTSMASFLVAAVGLLLILTFLATRAMFWSLRFKQKDGPQIKNQFNRWLIPNHSKSELYHSFVAGTLFALLVLLVACQFLKIEGIIVVAILNVFYISGLRYATFGNPIPKSRAYGLRRKRFIRNNWFFWIVYCLASFTLYINSQKAGNIKLSWFVILWGTIGPLLLVFSVFSQARIKAILKSWFVKGHVFHLATKNIYKAEICIWIGVMIIVPMLMVAFESEKIVSSTFSKYAKLELQQRTISEREAFRDEYSNYAFNKNHFDSPYGDFGVIDFSSAKITDDSSFDRAALAKYNTLTFSKTIFDNITALYPLEENNQPEATSNFGVPNDGRTSRAMNLVLLTIVVLILLWYAIRAFTNRVFFNITGFLKTDKDMGFPELAQASPNLKRLMLVNSNSAVAENSITHFINRIEPKAPLQLTLNFDQIHHISEETFNPIDYINAKASEMEQCQVFSFTNWYTFSIHGKELENKFNLLNEIITHPKFHDKHLILKSSATLQQMESYIKEKSFEKNASFNSKIYFKYFKSIFSGFREFVFPIDTVSFETQHISEHINQGLSKDESLLIKAQYMTPSFTSLWNSLSPEEKFVLFDIADDGLVNSKNWDTLLLLKRKALIVYDHDIFAFRCFDLAFAYYVRQSISQAEALEMENIAKKKGSWGAIKVALILIVASLFGLVYNFNPSVLDGFVGIIGAITTVIATFGKFTTSLKIPFISKNK